MDPDTVTPEWTYQDYEQKRSAKLDSLVEILLHHLARDGQPAIVPSRQVPTQPSAQQQQQQQQEPPQTGAQSNNLLPDKIVVYSYFPSSFHLIKMVSDHQRSELQCD
jgi:hypothetical protein